MSVDYDGAFCALAIALIINVAAAVFLWFTPKPQPDYQIIHVQGMPCVAFDNGDFAGLSCDWTRWEGDDGWR